MDSKRVQVATGHLRGFVDTAIIQPVSAGVSNATGISSPVLKYLGVPYGKAGRWEPCQPAELHNGVLDCLEFRDGPPQPWNPTEEMVKGKSVGGIERNHIPTSEQLCHALNIFIPHSSHDRGPLPVMVWIYGGGFTSGRADNPMYDATELVRFSEAEGLPVIVVTFNYRVNIFGFLSDSTLGLEGNYGFSDQVQCLRWIQQNISVFGGDPKQVMLFGESAGAISIASLATRDNTEREVLFQRVILQSGSALTLPARPARFTYLPELLSHCNISADLSPAEQLVQLKKVPTEHLIAFLGTIKNLKSAEWLWTTTVGGTAELRWSTSPALAFAQGRWDPAIEELIIGTVEDEGTIFAIVFDAQTPVKARELIHRVFASNTEHEATALKLYTCNEESNPPNQSTGAQFCTDRMFDAPALHLASAFSSSKCPCRLYTFRQPFAGLTGMPDLGVHHIIDVPMVFRAINLWDKDSEEDSTSREIARRWLSFASGKGVGEDWPVWSEESQKGVSFGRRGEVKVEDYAGEKKEKMAFWREVLEESIEVECRALEGL